MRYIKQKSSQCVLAAVCQIAPKLVYTELSELYPREKHITNLTVSYFFRHTCIYLPLADLLWQLQYKSVDKHNYIPIETVDISATGILIIAWKPRRIGHRHAISYSKGVVLDSAGDGQEQSLIDCLSNKWFVEHQLDIDVNKIKIA